MLKQNSCVLEISHISECNYSNYRGLLHQCVSAIHAVILWHATVIFCVLQATPSCISSLAKVSNPMIAILQRRLDLPGIFYCPHRCSPSWNCASRALWTCSGRHNTGPCIGQSPPALWASWQTEAWVGWEETWQISFFNGTLKLMIQHKAHTVKLLMCKLQSVLCYKRH